MSYSAVLGDIGPVFPVALTDNGAVFALDVDTDIVMMNYLDPSGALHVVVLTIEDPANGKVQRTWVAGDLPVLGAYFGQIKVFRMSDNTFPRTFPNDGSQLIWWILYIDRRRLRVAGRLGHVRAHWFGRHADARLTSPESCATMGLRGECWYTILAGTSNGS